MRMIMIREATDLEGLRSSLLKRGGRSATIERLQALNPHVDLQRLAPGTVLLVPDNSDVKTTATRAVGDDVSADFAALVDQSLSQFDDRLRAGAANREIERKEVAAVVKTDAVKRLIEADSALKRQYQLADERLAREKKRDEEVIKQVGEMRQRAAKELDELRKRMQ